MDIKTRILAPAVKGHGDIISTLMNYELSRSPDRFFIAIGLSNIMTSFIYYGPSPCEKNIPISRH